MQSQEQPNWQSSKIKSRIIKIRDMALHEFAYVNEREIHSDILTEAFGQQQNKWSKFFFDSLLTDVDKHYKPGVQSKVRKFSWNTLLYYFSQAGLTSAEEVAIKLGEKKVELQKVSNEVITLCLLQPEEKRAKDFFDLMDLCDNHRNLQQENNEYTEDVTTTRLLAHHQHRSKLVRSIFWAGWSDYDIDAASYCGLHQEALVKGLVKDGDFKFIEAAYRDKANFRNHLAQDLNISVDAVKVILAALIFNIKFSKNPYSQMCKKLRKLKVNTSVLYSKVDGCELLQNLIKDLENFWPLLMTDWEKTNGKLGRDVFRKLSKKVNKETGEIPSRYSAAKFRACIYFRIERKMLNSIRKFMSGKVCHLMHDGFFTPDPIDMEKLRNHIKQDISFNVSISEKILRSPKKVSKKL